MNINTNLFGELLGNRGKDILGNVRPNLFSSDGIDTLLTLAKFRSDITSFMEKYTNFSIRVDIADIEERFPFFKETPKELSKDDFAKALKIMVPIVTAKLSEEQKKKIEYFLVDMLELKVCTVEAFVDKFSSKIEESIDEKQMKALMIQSAITLSMEKGNISFGNALKQICKKVEKGTFISKDDLLSEKNSDFMKFIDICIPLISLLPEPDNTTETHEEDDKSSSDFPDFESFFNSSKPKF